MLNDLKQVLIEIKNRILSSRISLLFLIFLILIVILIGKLFDLQIIKGEYYQQNYIQKIEKNLTLPAVRGNIYDRNGNVLAYNRLAYAVTLIDNGDYKKYQDKNSMVYRLVKILNKHNEDILGNFLVGIDENGDYYYKVSSIDAKKRFLRDAYGIKKVEDLDDKDGKYPSDISAAELVNKKYEYYKLDETFDLDGNKLNLNAKEILDIINIRYTLSLSAYHKYDSIKIASDIKEETRVDLLENSANLLGLEIEEESLRFYNDSIYFSSIIGYTGKVLESQLEDLKSKSNEYTENDVVGRIGIEEYMDLELRGKKGYKKIYVDNVGHILDVVEENKAESGDEVYLTIDRDLQIGTYHLLEQQLAGILALKIVNEDNPNDNGTDSTNRKIPVKTAYYQLIGNNVLSIDNFKLDNTSNIEKNIYLKYLSYYDKSMSMIEKEIKDENAKDLKDLSDELREFIVFIYNYLSSDEQGIILKDNINTGDQQVKEWKADTISFNEYLRYLIANNLIDNQKLKLDTKYLSSEDVYNSLIENILASLREDKNFEKLLYRHLIKNSIITGRELCLSLFEQNVLKYDEEEYNKLYANGENYAYSFLIKKISNMEISPASLALEPSTASAIVTDVKTGELRALVSYPGYDNNRLSNNMDVAYYNKLLNDESLPLYNNATQSRKAPGSIFKPITAIAGLEEGVIDAYDKIACLGEYDVIKPSIKCWIYPGMHSELNLKGAMTHSCNIYFSEIGHRLSMKKDGEYSVVYGIERLSKYAKMFGLDSKTGVELVENEPLITTMAPEQSAIGQGTNSFANIHIARYITALANQGTVYNLSLLDKLVSKEGVLEKDYNPSVYSHVELADSTWKAVKEGMRGVVADGSVSSLFKDLQVEIAGKTGTAQESKTRANHANFVSFAPYSDPEVAVTVNIPYGYTSSNAVMAAKNIYKLYFGYTNLDLIMNSSALDVTNIKIGD